MDPVRSSNSNDSDEIHNDSKKSKTKSFTGKTDAKTNGKVKVEEKDTTLKKAKTEKETLIDKSKVTYKPSDFKIMKEVGEGSYGRVYLASRNSDSKMVAIKMLDKHHL